MEKAEAQVIRDHTRLKASLIKWKNLYAISNANLIKKRYLRKQQEARPEKDVR